MTPLSRLCLACGKPLSDGLAIDGIRLTVKTDTGTYHNECLPKPPATYQGMTLRDYFAAQALVAMTTWSPGGGRLDQDDGLMERAQWAYRQADAMLKSRSGG